MAINPVNIAYNKHSLTSGGLLTFDMPRTNICPPFHDQNNRYLAHVFVNSYTNIGTKMCVTPTRVDYVNVSEKMSTLQRLARIQNC